MYSKVEIFGIHQNLVQTSRTTTNTSALLPSRNELKAITFSKLACLPYFKRRRIYMYAGVTTWIDILRHHLILIYIYTWKSKHVHVCNLCSWVQSCTVLLNLPSAQASFTKRCNFKPNLSRHKTVSKYEHYWTSTNNTL